MSDFRIRYLGWVTSSQHTWMCVRDEERYLVQKWWVYDHHVYFTPQRFRKDIWLVEVIWGILLRRDDRKALVVLQEMGTWEKV